VVFDPAVWSGILLASSPEHDGDSPSGSATNRPGGAAFYPCRDDTRTGWAEVEDAERPPGCRLPGGRLRQRVVEKKKEEYEEYAERMKALAEQYVPPEKDLIQAAYEKGNISMTPGPGGLKLVIHNYVKPGDSMTLTIDKEQKQLQSIQIASYMDGPSDGMNLTVRFDRLPDGTNHVSSTTVEGVSKQLTVATQNANYQKR